MRKWLQQAREDNNLTQQQVAEAIHVSESYYSFIESGKRQKKMDVALAAKLSVVFNIPVEQIVELEAKEED